jgi:hypothetical protein
VPVATDPQATASPSMISFGHGGSGDWVVVQCIAKLHLHDSGTFFLFGSSRFALGENTTELRMNGLIYLIGLIVVIMAVLSLLGLR